ncbi:MAG TPA: vWA domain-containing protein [Pyrinomonadaceae bacterium]|jgi:Mg-chelatase subunit ChlD|nr:vWA domain-containing protein [Pyrinomonadaceae bacterium]
MRRNFFSIPAAILTFVLGVGTVMALVRTPAADQPPPPKTSDEKTLEMVFVIDTTGSMGGLIEGAKQRVWGVINEVMRTPAHPAVRVGLVAYRDHGDQYVTQVLPLTNDLDRVYTTLMDYRAEGGGDTPEDVRQALADGVGKAGWSKTSANTAQIVFLVGDAPPHDDYSNEPDTLDTTAQAVKAGMTVNTIQCGTADDTRRVWQQIARRGEGQYFAIAQDGGVQSITTPYDTRLSELGNRLGSTFTAYGGGAGVAGESYRRDAATRQASSETKVVAAAPVVAQADRAVNKALNKDAYVGDLLQSIENGSVKLDDVKTEDLPDDLQKLSAADRRKEVEHRLADRQKIRDEIVSLSKQRDDFINAERRKQTGGQNGFDSAVASALKDQMAKKGIK